MQAAAVRLATSGSRAAKPILMNELRVSAEPSTRPYLRSGTEVDK